MTENDTFIIRPESTYFESLRQVHQWLSEHKHLFNETAIILKIYGWNVGLVPNKPFFEATRVTLITGNLSSLFADTPTSFVFVCDHEHASMIYQLIGDIQATNLPFTVFLDELETLAEVESL